MKCVQPELITFNPPMKPYLKTFWRAIRNKPMIVVNVSEKVNLRTALDVILSSTFDCKIEVLLDNVIDYSMKNYTIPRHPSGRKVKIVAKNHSVLSYK